MFCINLGIYIISGIQTKTYIACYLHLATFNMVSVAQFTLHQALK